MVNVLALVTFKVFPSKMGGQKGVGLFYTHLAKYLKVTLAVSPDNDVQDAQAHGIEAIPLLYSNRKIYRNTGRLKKLRQLVRTASIQAVISEHSYPAFFVLWLRRKTGVPFIIHSHNIETLRFRQMGRWWWSLYFHYERWVHRQSDFNFFISREDQDYALEAFALEPQKCAVITYGIEQKSCPSVINKLSLKRSLGFKEDDWLFLFNGTLDYAPNVKAVQDLVQKIIPILSVHLPNYKIVITGARATQDFINQINYHPAVSYQGFVEDIDLYYRAADLFLNPVVNDSGVKTKVIEAIANNCTVVSFAAGASGMRAEVCSHKLLTVRDEDYEAFSRLVLEQAKKAQSNTPASFYEYYNWDNIAQKAATIINKVTSKHV